MPSVFPGDVLRVVEHDCFADSAKSCNERPTLLSPLADFKTILK